MRKQERMFRMLKWIAIAPGLSVGTLATLLDITDRGIYRWVAELRKAGAPITAKKDAGYTLQSESFSVYGIPFDHNLIHAIDLRMNGNGAAVDGDGLPRFNTFLPRMLYIETGLGTTAAVKFEFGDPDSVSDEIVVDQLSSLQVNLAASGVQVEAIKPDRGMDSVVVRWR